MLVQKTSECGVDLCIWSWNSLCSRPRHSPPPPFAPLKTWLPSHRWCRSKSAEERPKHTHQCVSMNVMPSALFCLVVPVLPVVSGCHWQTLGQHLSTQQRCIETHLLLRLTPEDMEIQSFKTYFTDICNTMFLILFTLCLCCSLARDADPWRDGPTLSILTENNQLPKSFLLQCR